MPATGHSGQLSLAIHWRVKTRKLEVLGKDGNLGFLVFGLFSAGSKPRRSRRSVLPCWEAQSDCVFFFFSVVSSSVTYLFHNVEVPLSSYSTDKNDCEKIKQKLKHTKTFYGKRQPQTNSE